MGAAGHEGSFQAGQMSAVEHTGSDAHDVLGGRADFDAQQVLAVVETDEGTREGID